MTKIVGVIGTRPEAIKMAPVIRELRNRNSVQVSVVATSQHREILKQVLGLFDIVPDIDLDVMEQNQSLPSLTSKILTKTCEVFEKLQPDIVIVQGDTTTVMASALAAFYRKINVAHVEAGLRTGDVYNPFPEEINRALVSRFARWHFAPTESAKHNLLREGISENKVFITGNTVIDALYFALNKSSAADEKSCERRKVILVTCHRRENFGAPLEDICSAIVKISEAFPELLIKFPAHPNPNVQSVVRRRLEGKSNILLMAPLDYLSLVKEMSNSYIIMTDSGGIQEEAPALGKPVLVLRGETERPEAISAGVAQLVGTECDAIYCAVRKLVLDQRFYSSMAKGASPYGDGLAAKRIADILIGQ